MNISPVRLIGSLIDFYALLIFVYVILSWFPASLGEVRRVLGTICEPYIGLFRRFLPVVGMGGAGVDFSPIVAYVFLRFVIQPVLVYIVSGLG